MESFHERISIKVINPEKMKVIISNINDRINGTK